MTIQVSEVYHMEQAMPDDDHHLPRRHRIVHRWVLVGLMLLPAVVRAGDEGRPVAGEPLVLKHPSINKSVGNPVHCLTFLDGGNSLATGATSGVLIWDVLSGELRRTLEVDDRAVDSLILDPTGTRLVAGGASGIIKIFDARSFQLLHTLGPTSGAVRGLAISPDARLLASASPNGQLGKADPQFGILLWDLATGKLLKTISHPSPAFGTTALAFLPDGRQLITAQDRAFRLISVEKGEVLKTIEVPDLPRSFGSLAIHKTGRLVTGVFEPAIRLWNIADWEQERSWAAHDEEPPPKRGVSTVEFSPDGAWVLSGGMDGMVCVWEASSGRCLHKLDGRGDSARWITGVAMSANGSLLAASNYGGTATVWRLSHNKQKPPTESPETRGEDLP